MYKIILIFMLIIIGCGSYVYVNQDSFQDDANDKSLTKLSNANNNANKNSKANTVNESENIQQQSIPKTDVNQLNQQAMLATPSQCKMLKTKGQLFAISDGQNYPNTSTKIKFSMLEQDKNKVEKSENKMIDMHRQMMVADVIYQETLGLTAPLSKPRYQKADFINVRLRTFKNNSGMAYDEVTGSHSLGKNCFLNIGMNPAKVQANANVTPAHELFHLYQHSSFMFKQRWLTEGTARWSEYLFAKGVGKGADTTLPQTNAQLVAVMQETYSASKMFTRLFRLMDESNSYQLPSRVQDINYLNGKPIIQDNLAYGTAFIKTLFIELEKQSFIASHDKGWAPYQWQEKDQKDSSLNPYIWIAIQDTVNQTVPKKQQSQELRTFINLSL